MLDEPVSRNFERNASRRGLISRFPSPVRAVALSSALPLAGEAGVHELAVALIHAARSPRHPWFRRSREHHADIALTEIARRWEWIPPDLRPVAARVGVGRWAEVTRSLLTSPHAAERRAVAMLAHDLGDLTLVPSLCTLLADAEPQVIESANSALLAIAGSGASSSAIDAAIADALRSFSSHRSRALVELALERLGPDVLAPGDPSADPSPLRAWFHDGQTDMSPLQAALRRGRSRTLRTRAFEWLVHPRLRIASIDRLAQPAPLPEHAAILGLGALALRPSRAAAMHLLFNGSAQAVRCVLPAPEELHLLPPQARRAVTWLLRDGSAPAVVSLRMLEPMLGDTDEVNRLAAVHTAPIRLLRDFCFDPSPPVAVGAITRLIERPTRLEAAERRVLSRLHAAPSPHVRELARQWETPHSVDDPLTRMRWRIAISRDPDAAVSALRRELVDAHPLARPGVIALLRALDLIAPFEAELAEFCRLPSGELEDRTTSAAVAALGTASTSRAAEIIRAALEHPSPRVRANAIECGGQTSRTAKASLLDTPALVELKSAPEHRVAATAIRVLGQRGLDPSAPADACRMMRDSAALRRASGTWAASRLLAEPKMLGTWWYELARELRERLEDPEPKVARRAALALSRLGLGQELEIP